MWGERQDNMTVAKAMAAAAASRRVCFLTDVEGNWVYVRNFVRQSTCLRFADQAHSQTATRATRAAAQAVAEEQLELNDDCFLVFGGDAGDKGGETLQCYEQLVRLKKKYPDRVVLLVGNRDANKMRLTSELDDNEMDFDTMAKEIREGPLWVPQERRVTLEDFLARQLSGEAKKPQSGDTGDSDQVTEKVNDRLLQATNTKVNRLQWMLEHTMGAQGDFERRRKEIASRVNDASETTVSDESVLQSYLDSVQRGGVLREYLELGSLAFVAHDTLFVHGGIIAGANGGVSSLGRVPSAPSTHLRSVSEWVEELNGWYRSQVQEWIDQPTWTPDHTTRGGNDLLKYTLPDYPASVVMGRHLQSSGMPTQLPADLVQMLSENGIKRLIVGHTPHGNCPTVIKQKRSAAAAAGDLSSCFEEVIMCDTSYSNMKADDNRGDAAAELVLDFDGRVHIHGVLEDQRPIAFTSDDPIIGRELRDGTQVKAKLTDTRDSEEDEFLVYSVKNGFEYTYQYRKLHELEEIGFQD